MAFAMTQLVINVDEGAIFSLVLTSILFLVFLSKELRIHIRSPAYINSAPFLYPLSPDDGWALRRNVEKNNKFIHYQRSSSAFCYFSYELHAAAGDLSHL